MSAPASADMVLLPGWGFSAAVFEPWLRLWRPVRQVHALELPANGDGAAAPAALEAAVESLLLAAPENAHWVGWSLGGMITLAAAAAAPARVGAVTLIAATPRFTRAADWPHAMASAELTRFRDGLSDDVPRTLRRFAALCARGGADSIGLSRTLAAACLKGSPAALHSGLSMLAELDLRALLRRAPQRLRFILGGCDPLIPAAVIDDLRSFRPDLDCLCLDDAGHAPFLSHQQACAEFLESE